MRVKSEAMRRLMSRRGALVAALLVVCGCSRDASSVSTAATTTALDSLNARIVRAYREHDSKGYGALYTDSAQFEWPAVPTVRGRAGLETMAHDVWTPLPDLDLKLIVATRRIAATHATELGAFEESWRDSTGGRTTEFGRYVVLFAKAPDDTWRIDRFLGFSDSTTTRPPAR
ncbi:MAG: hypothetical protein JWL95_1678 [Gemmatimonadetes bacterium]|nr:hypothetical protein [Gemmatimonadota bacterium]